jgi:ABC-type sugar transport system substrate-binding protein
MMDADRSIATGGRTNAMALSTNLLRRIAGAAAVALGLAVIAAGLSSVVAQEKPKASPPVLVTSLGQSLDAFQIQLAVRRAGIKYKYDARAEVDQLDDVKTLFLGVGASLKGFGEAGITIKDELARAVQLLDAAKSRGIFVVVLHMGGEERRDALSNQLIELTAPRAKLLIIRNDSDADGKFAEIAKANKIPVVVIDNVLNLRGPLQELFAGG